MSNTYLKATIEKKLTFSNFDFLRLKDLSPGQFLGSSSSLRYHWILKLFVETSNQRSGSKTVCGFSVILTLKWIMTFWYKTFMQFVEQKYRL